MSVASWVWRCEWPKVIAHQKGEGASGLEVGFLILDYSFSRLCYLRFMENDLPHEFHSSMQSSLFEPTAYLAGAKVPGW